MRKLKSIQLFEKENRTAKLSLESAKEIHGGKTGDTQTVESESTASGYLPNGDTDCVDHITDDKGNIVHHFLDK